MRAAINASNVPFENIDTLVLGNVLHVSRSHILYKCFLNINIFLIFKIRKYSLIQTHIGIYTLISYIFSSRQWVPHIQRDTSHSKVASQSPSPRTQWIRYAVRDCRRSRPLPSNSRSVAPREGLRWRPAWRAWASRRSSSSAIHRSPEEEAPVSKFVLISKFLFKIFNALSFSLLWILFAASGHYRNCVHWSQFKYSNSWDNWFGRSKIQYITIAMRGFRPSFKK